MEENKSLDINKKVKRWIILGFVVLILFNIYSLVKINDLQEQIQNDIHNLDIMMAKSISDTKSELQDSLKESHSIISGFRYKEEGFNADKKEINLTFYGSPKVYKEGLKFYFTYTSNGETKSVQGALGSNKEYSAKVAIPLSNEIKFGVMLDYGDEVKKEMWDGNYMEIAKHQLQLVPIGFQGETKKLEDNKVEFKGKITTNIYPSAIEGNYVAEPFCNIVINDNMVEKLKLEKNPKVPSEYSVNLNKTYKLNEGDRLQIFVEVYDLYGFNYKYCARTTTNENGKIVDLDFSIPNDVVIITP
ncbi:hypothetical protein [Clostridium sp.]|uniref:hypothetical protein n=1 Tax=Clostridium sp. TaxID=1506 RepID=UPI003217B4A1